MHLAYDKGNQLVQVTVQEEGKHFRQRYRYDAFGRRLAKYNDPGNSGASEESGTDYYGWDGDRLVHTERFNSGNAKSSTDTPQPEVIHTVYEPGSFTPLIQLRRAAKAEPDLADELIAHMQPGIAQEALRGMFADIGATASKVNAGLGNLGMAVDAQEFIREQLKEFEQTVNSQREESAKSVEVRHYLCDHLGTPNALVNDRGQIEWATVLDAWGNVKGEHNPHNLYQPIRLPGQHEDRGSGYYYNRHRYFSSENATYVNQDPIRWIGGLNYYSYPTDPLDRIDPEGLSGKIPKDFGKDKPITPIEKPETGPHPIDKVYDQIDPNKKIWQSMSPYDYTQFCKKWKKEKLTCQPSDREPGYDVKYPSDYVPLSQWKTSELPNGYKCADAEYFPELNSRGSAPAADVDDQLELMRKIMRTRGGRK